jgi:hypothetical protein
MCWDNCLPGAPVEPSSRRPCRCEGSHRHFRHGGCSNSPSDPELAARRHASRIQSSFPPWITRRVSRRSAYIPAVDTPQQKQENCILRDRMHYRGEVLQTDDEKASHIFHVAASAPDLRAIPQYYSAVLKIGDSKHVVVLPAARRIQAAAGRSLDLVRSNRQLCHVQATPNSAYRPEMPNRAEIRGTVGAEYSTHAFQSFHSLSFHLRTVWLFVTMLGCCDAS